MENPATTARLKIARQKPERILIIQTAFLGDVILVEPLIAQTKERFPDARIDVIVIPAAGNLLETHPAIDGLIRYDKRNRERGLVGFFRLVGRLKKKRYHLALVPHRSLRSAALAWLAKIPLRIGFDKSAGRFLFHHCVQYRQAEHEVIRNLSLLEPFGLAAKYRKPEIYLRTEDERKSADLLTALTDRPTNGKSEPQSQLIAFAPGSIWATKRWPVEKFVALGKKLLAENTYRVVLLGSEKDRALCEQITEALGSNALDLSGKLSLRESTAMLKKCSVLVSNDSAPTHLGVAAGCRVVTIFGATIPSFGFYPHGNQHKIIETELELPCRPCGIHGGNNCPIGTFDCMHSISAERVFNEIKKMNTKQASPAPIRKIAHGTTAADIESAVTVLQNDGIVLLPTETLYGLAANVFSEKAVRRIFALKKRAGSEPLPLICASFEQVAAFCEFAALERVVAETFWPGPLTLVLKAKSRLPRHIVAADGSVAVRVPSSELCRSLAAGISAPLTATSANISGEKPIREISEIPQSMATGVDLIFDAGKCTNRLPSTIVKISGDQVDILREGIISADEIHARRGVHD